MNSWIIIWSFCKTHSTLHAFFRLIQSWKKELDNSGLVGTILTDLSKTYDCLLYDLLITELEAYALDKPSLKLVYNCLSFRKQRERIDSSFSDWTNVTRGIPKGSILRSLLFNIFINDIFLFIEKFDVCNFADDNKLLSCGDNL